MICRVVPAGWVALVARATGLAAALVLTWPLGCRRPGAKGRPPPPRFASPPTAAWCSEHRCRAPPPG